jgi:hypothetical protein
MYISSDGTKKSVSTLNSEYILNALNKAQREIFNSQSLEDYNKYINNICVLRNEIDSRIDNFVKENIKIWEA